MRSKSLLSLLLIPSILAPSLGVAAPSNIRVRMNGFRVSVNAEDSTSSKTSSFNPSISEQQINSCLVSMCGAPDQSGSGAILYYKRLSQADKSQGRTWNREFAPLIEPLVREKQQLEIDQAKLLIATLKRKDAVLREDSPLKNFIAMIYLMKMYPDKNTEKLWTFENGTYDINSAGLQELVKNAPPNDAKAFELIMRKVYLTIFRSAVAIPSEPGLPSRLKFLYPGLTRSEALVADSAISLRKIEALKKLLGETMMGNISDDSIQTILQKASQGQDLSPRETDLYAKFSMNLDFFAPMFLDQEVSTALQNTSLHLNDLLNEYKKTDDAQKHYLKAIQSLKDDTPDKISSICKVNLNRSLILNTSQYRIDRLKSYLPEIKKAAKEVAAQYAGPNSKISDAIENTTFSLPEVNSNRLESIRAAIEAEKKSNQNYRQLLNAKNKNQQMELILMLAVVRGMDSKDKDAVEDSDVTKACKSLPQSYLSDYALSALGKISLSWYTAAYPDLGVGVVAHELGHVVDSKFRQELADQINSDGFKQSMSCVVHRNPFQDNLVGAENNAAVTSRFAQEDWADHFATQVIEVLKKKGFAPVQNGRNWACTLVKGDTLFDHSYYSSYSLQAGEKDSHSSGLLRALMNNFDRGQVTPECRPLMQPIEDLHRHMKCQ